MDYNQFYFREPTVPRRFAVPLPFRKPFASLRFPEPFPSNKERPSLSPQQREGFGEP